MEKDKFISETEIDRVFDPHLSDVYNTANVYLKTSNREDQIWTHVGHIILTRC